MADQNQSLTILRVKRKVGEEPLDALLIDPAYKRLKKRLRPSIDSPAFPGVFKFAHTSESAEYSAQDQAALQDRLQEGSLRPDEAPATFTSYQAPSQEPSTPSEPSAPSEKPRYRVIRALSDSYGKRRKSQGVPKDGEAGRMDGWRILDAVRESADQQTAPLSDAARGANATAGVEDIGKFSQMLEEYLRISHPEGVHLDLDEAPSAGAATDAFVYDIYYHAGETGSQHGYGSAFRVGEIYGLADEDFELEEEKSDSEPGDEVDEDSNDESFYRNDYPDEDDEDDEEGNHSKDSDYIEPSDEEY